MNDQRGIVLAFIAMAGIVLYWVVALARVAFSQ